MSALKCLNPVLISACALMLLTASCFAAGAEAAPEGAQVTIKGNVLCRRAMLEKPWDGTSQDSDHIPVVFAFEGTPEIAAALEELTDAFYPAEGLDVEAARRFNEEFGRRLAYFVAPGELATKLHREVEWGSQLLAVTGTVFEKDARRWIAVSAYEPTTIEIPGKMVEPDKPFVMPSAEPLLLETGDGVTLKCILLPAGRFLQGSPFYQQRYQDEYPHEVVLTKPFYVSETPVTREMFAAVMGGDGVPDGQARFAVKHAKWADIMEFCRRLSQKSGRRVRLPRDAEWEYAARIGTSNPCFKEKYLDQISRTGSGKQDEEPVMSAAPNTWGLYDMLCGGWHIKNDYKADNVRVKQVDPTGPRPGDPSIQKNDAGPMHKSRGGWHYSFIRPNMHGAAGEDGGIWEGGAPIFRIVVEAE